MRVCVLSDEVLEDFNPGHFLQGHEWEMLTIQAPVLETIKAAAAQNKYNVYLNLCEGYEDGDDYDLEYGGIDVIEALEHLNLPYTGANPKFFDPSREEMQAAADANGIGFAKGYQVRSVEEAERLVADLRFPIMVKHPKSYGSTGMFKESRTDTPEQMKTQVERVCAEFGAARMEEFIVGREFNVLVADNPDDLSDPFAYPPMEVIFPKGEEFWHVDVKWDYSLPLEFRQVVEEPLASRLQDVTRRLFLALNGVGYGRTDIRMNDQGELFILEINPNSGIMYLPKEFGPADYMILYDKDGYKGFFDRIFRSAIVRQKMRAKAI